MAGKEEGGGATGGKGGEPTIYNILQFTIWEVTQQFNPKKTFKNLTKYFQQLK